MEATTGSDQRIRRVSAPNFELLLLTRSLTPPAAWPDLHIGASARAEVVLARSGSVNRPAASLRSGSWGSGANRRGRGLGEGRCGLG